jgi:CheY-like chemotaxis protein
LASSQAETTAVAAPQALISSGFEGKLVVVIDDDLLVLEGMSGLLRSWGLEVVAASSAAAALSQLAAHHWTPDLIISDYRLQVEETGTELIGRLRAAFGTAIPAFLISGDTNPELLNAVRASGYQMLHKPVDPMKLRALLSVLLKSRAGVLASA